MSELVKLLKEKPKSQAEGKQLFDLLAQRVPPGVDEAAYVKAAFLASVAKGAEKNSPIVSKTDAVNLLGTMQGGYNVAPLIECLSASDDAVAKLAADHLKKTLLMFDAFHDVEELAKKGICVKTKQLSVKAKRANFLRFLQVTSTPKKC